MALTFPDPRPVAAVAAELATARFPVAVAMAEDTAVPDEVAVAVA